MHCFKCVQCERQLNTGDEFGIGKDGMSIYCRTHYYFHLQQQQQTSAVSSIQNGLDYSNSEHQLVCGLNSQQQYHDFNSVANNYSMFTKSEPSVEFNSTGLCLQQQQQQAPQQHLHADFVVNGNGGIQVPPSHFSNPASSSVNYMFMCNMPPTPGISPPTPNSTLTNSNSINSASPPTNQQQQLIGSTSNTAAAPNTAPPSTAATKGARRPKKRKAANANASPATGTGDSLNSSAQQPAQKKSHLASSKQHNSSNKADSGSSTPNAESSTATVVVVKSRSSPNAKMYQQHQINLNNSSSLMSSADSPSEDYKHFDSNLGE